MRKRVIFWIVVLIFLMSMAFAPMGYVHAAVSGGYSTSVSVHIR